MVLNGRVADPVENDCTTSKTTADQGPAPSVDAAEEPSMSEGVKVEPEEEAEKPLKPLTDISWPPEPDSSVFTDPLKRDDPKPLRPEELMRIGES